MSNAAIGQAVREATTDEKQSAKKFSFEACVKSIAVIAVLSLLLPISLVATLFAFVVRLFARSAVARNGETVMLSGGKMTKALQLARLFHRAGYRVVLCETADYQFTAHRFSNAVDQFAIVPKPDAANYADALCEIVNRESVDYYVPVCSPVSSHFDSLAKERLSQHCRVIHVSPEQIETLDNKFLFAQAAKSAALPVPMTFRITDPQQVLDFDFEATNRPFILKSIAYDPVRRLDMTQLQMKSETAMRQHLASLPISESNPWILQEFISGQEFCTHSTVIDGELRVHVCCESSAFQVNYDPIDEPEIHEWVKAFCQSLSPTGQLSFDFIKADDDGQYYAIECNPRTHSAITAFYANDNFAPAWFSKDWSADSVTPNPDSKPTFWMAHEVSRIASAILRLNFAKALQRLRIVFRGKEAVFELRDPLPFLMLHHLHVPALLLRAAISGRDWMRIDFNIGKLVRAGGD